MTDLRTALEPILDGHRANGAVVYGPSGAVTMLRELHRDASGILSYSELYALYPGDDDSRVRQLVSQFADSGLVERFGPRTNRKVELLPTGERVLDEEGAGDFYDGFGRWSDEQADRVREARRKSKEKRKRRMHERIEDGA